MVFLSKICDEIFAGAQDSFHRCLIQSDEHNSNLPGLLFDFINKQQCILIYLGPLFIQTRRESTVSSNVSGLF